MVRHFQMSRISIAYAILAVILSVLSLPQFAASRPILQTTSPLPVYRSTSPRFASDTLSSLKELDPKLEYAIAKYIRLLEVEEDVLAKQYAFENAIDFVGEDLLLMCDLGSGIESASIQEEELSRFGATVQSRSTHFLTIKCPPLNASKLATSLTQVIMLKRVPKPFIEVESEGVELTGAAIFHENNVTGTGTKVAVIDIGFERLGELQESGELPEDLEILDYGFGNIEDGGAHGTACTQVVHNMAPDAELTLVHLYSYSDLENSIEYFMRHDIRVSTMSLSFPDPVSDYFQGTDAISLVVNRAAREGLLFVNSAGNSAQQHYRADFDDGGNGDDMHRFTHNRVVNHFGDSEQTAYNLAPNQTISATLLWDDFPMTNQDYDLYMFRYDSDNNSWVEVASSAGEQDGDDRPIETISFRIRTAGAYGVMVRRMDADIESNFTINSSIPLAMHTSEGSLLIPAIAEGAYAVGAVDFREWGEDDPQIEAFSSQGPTYDGRVKPNIAAPDGVTSSIYEDGFYGTSGAAPHVAGAASLLLSAYPDLCGNELREILNEQARDVGDEGEDNVFGFGLLHIDVDLQRNPPILEINLEGEQLSIEAAANQYFISEVLRISNRAEAGQRHLQFRISGNESGQDLPLSWLSATPSDGFIEPGETVQIGLSLKPNLLEENGNYEGELHIRSNDPQAGDSVIPFTLRTGEVVTQTRLVPQGYQTIQEAIIQSFRGDTILVDTGRYIENLDISGREIVLASRYIMMQSDSLIFKTVIDGGGQNPVVTFRSGESNDTKLIGFTIENGRGRRFDQFASKGGGIYCAGNSSPTLSHLNIQENEAVYGAAIYSETGVDQVMEYLTIRGNWASSCGAMALLDGDYKLNHLTITGNIAFDLGSSIYLERNANVNLKNSTLAANTAFNGATIFLYDSCTLELDNTILWNSRFNEVSFASQDRANQFVADYCLIRGGQDAVELSNNGVLTWGEHNIVDDPRFVGIDRFDLHLTEESPCIDTGDPVMNDPDGSVSDIGAFFFPQYPLQAINRDSLSFGRTFIGYPAILDLTIRNIGYQNLHVTEIQVSGECFEMECDDEISLARFDSCIVRVEFNPEMEGDYQGSLVIESNALNEPQMTIPLIGTGYEAHPPEIVAEIADVQLEEDFERYCVINLNEVFDDANGDRLNFSSISNNQNIIVEIDGQGDLWISSSENWSGEAEISITADDLIDLPDRRQHRGEADKPDIESTLSSNIASPRRDQSSECRFEVRVSSINDAPIWRSAIDNLTFDEDSGPWMVANLDTLFYDVERDAMSFECETSEGISWTIDDAHLLTLDSRENLCGEGFVVRIIAEDRHGRAQRSVRTFESLNSNFRQTTSINRIVPLPSVTPQRDDATEAAINLTLNPINDRPGWAEMPPELVDANEGDSLHIEFLAADPDGDIPHIVLRQDGGTLNRGASFRDRGDGSATFDWRCRLEDEGEYRLNLMLSDGRLELFNTFVRIIVVHGNNPPVLVNPIPDYTLDEDCARYPVADLSRVFADADEERLEFSFDAVDSLTIQIQNDSLFAQPAHNWNGYRRVVVSASDGNAITNDTFCVTIRPINDAPFLAVSFDSIQVVEDAGYFELGDLDDYFTDPENDRISFELVNTDPRLGANVDERFNMLSITPEHNFSSNDGILLQISARDHPAEAETTEEVPIYIMPVNDPPTVFSLLSPEEGYEVLRRSYNVEFKWNSSLEVDDDTVSYDLNIHIEKDNIDTLLTWTRLADTTALVRLDSILIGLGICTAAENETLLAEWWVSATDGLTAVSSNSHRHISIPLPLSIGHQDGGQPLSLGITTISPNPFNAITRIAFGLPTATFVTVKVFDVSGRQIAVLISRELGAGYQEVSWNAESNDSGTYFVRFETASYNEVKSITLVR